jgi:hypothetical protein
LKYVIEKLPITLFIGSLCFFSILSGMVIWDNKLFPYEQIAPYKKELRSLLPDKVLELAGNSEKQIKEAKRPSFLVPIRYSTSGVTIHDADAVAPGIILLTSHWPEYGWRPGLRLIDSEGNLLHRWDVDIKKIWGFGLFQNADASVHGSYLFPNGDVLFNVDYTGLVRLDACGEVVWKTDSNIMTHHSVFRAENGNFWVAGYRRIEKDNPRAKLFPVFSKPFGEDLLLEFTPDGSLVREISLLEAVYNTDYKHLLWNFKSLRRRWDVLHLNNVELLGRDLADDFPMFDEGDILVSLRELNVVAVLNPTGEIKWIKVGEFTRQHDPDFEPGGWITVFDNRWEEDIHKGTHLGGSRIVAIDPVTDEIRELYPGKKQTTPFYTQRAGMHQLLNNGNRLIIEAQAARVFEVSPGNEVVWEWIAQPFDDEYVAEVFEGTRYPNISVSDVRQWPCHHK